MARGGLGAGQSAFWLRPGGLATPVLSRQPTPRIPHRTAGSSPRSSPRPCVSKSECALPPGRTTSAPTTKHQLTQCKRIGAPSGTDHSFDCQVGCSVSPSSAPVSARRGCQATKPSSVRTDAIGSARGTPTSSRGIPGSKSTPLMHTSPSLQRRIDRAAVVMERRTGVASKVEIANVGGSTTCASGCSPRGPHSRRAERKHAINQRKTGWIAPAQCQQVGCPSMGPSTPKNCSRESPSPNPVEAANVEYQGPVLTAKLAARLLADLLDAYREFTSVEEACSAVGGSWGFDSSADMMRCIEMQANASYCWNAPRATQ